MEITSAASSLSLPLPLYDSRVLGEATDRDGQEFLIMVGMDKAQALRLRELSLDEDDRALQDNTSDRKRFGDGSYEDWYAKSRTIFTLIHKDTGEIAAVTWFGPKPLGRKSAKHLSEKEQAMDEATLETGDWHTISYRCYPNFRGKGLMKAFVKFAIEVYEKSIPNVKLWAGMHSENAASDGLALSLGFMPFEEASDKEAQWSVMVRE